ncbi:hypothetical protein IAD21_06054 [Abditibacteriota bacterium]|nr:hypothetical protein IAD21_06054 [Abditibacteriota bacterium]
MTNSTEYSVQHVAERLHGSLSRYLQGQYHISDANLIEERRLLLEAEGTIGQRPFIETTPTYKQGEPYATLGLPSPLGETFAQFAEWNPDIGIFPHPYIHQADALRQFFIEKRDLIVATGTGSGKTESFLFPILGQLLLEAAQRPSSWQMPGCRALLLYPMNALVSDQLSRLRRLFGDPRLAQHFRDLGDRHPRFGMYTSRTPYPGIRSSKKDAKHLDKILQYYLRIENPQSDPKLTESQREEYSRLETELKKGGRWPAKDLHQFFGASGGRWNKRLQTENSDRELLTRHEMQTWCPDLLITNYSMLEYMLLRPIERSLFQQTRDWLDSDPSNELILVLDEAHMYRGVGGAEVALLIRRLQARLGIERERMRCILTSASLGKGEQAEQGVRHFAVGLTGHPANNPDPFTLIRGELAPRPSAKEGSTLEAQALAQFDVSAFFNYAEDLSSAVNAVQSLAETMGWPPVPQANYNANDDERDAADERFRTYLFETLGAYGPINLLINQTSGHALEWEMLACTLFPAEPLLTAIPATGALLALGTYARQNDRPLLPTRVHLFFRGLPGLYACINNRCPHRRYLPSEEQLLGRLYTEPRTHCECGARVFELWTHRDCGAPFLRVFGRGHDADFYWHEQGGNVRHVSQPLVPTLLLVGKPHENVPPESIEEIWVDITTGQVKVSEPADTSNFRLFYRPGGNAPVTKSSKRKAETTNEEANAAPDAPFPSCPACKKQSGQKIMDLVTKGEQPFATLVREQLSQQPAKEKVGEMHPNGGRKVLLFSDGRQKAARLARDLPREVEFDSFRQAIILAAHRLNELGVEARINDQLYVAFLDVCQEFYLDFFDRIENTRNTHRENLDTYGDRFDDLEEAIEALKEGEFTPSVPLGYNQALLRQLCNPYYSLYWACAAYIAPSSAKIKSLKKALKTFPSDFLEDHLDELLVSWIQEMLEHTAFDKSVGLDARREVNEWCRQIASEEKFGDWSKLLLNHSGLTESQVEQLRSVLMTELTDADDNSGRYLTPKALVLVIAVKDAWQQCQDCGLTCPKGLFGRCPHCEGEKLEAREPEHPYMKSRKEYFRGPLREALEGMRISHLSAEEHTAQLSHRDAGEVHATTEEFELRFQDIWLSKAKPPVDVLSCTTTMEVGIDIGSLTAVGLRNVPPQRENYQQRAGRSGRRGAAVSTVLTYAQGGAHDNFYYANPSGIISGAPRDPKIKVDNRRLAKRHIHSFLIQTFFHETLDGLSHAERKAIETDDTRSNILSAFGSLHNFVAPKSALNSGFSREDFKQWLNKDMNSLISRVATWLPDEICVATTAGQIELEKREFALQTAQNLEAAINNIEELASVIEANGNEGEGGTPDLKLLDALFDTGLLPSYAFPTDVCTFYVFEEEGGTVKIKERPQQDKLKALSEYAPGRLLVVNKETYRVGGIYQEGVNSVNQAESLFDEKLARYTWCRTCGFVSMGHTFEMGDPCPVCSENLHTNQLLDPPGFSPERGRPVRERDREQDISYATSAQFPTPLEAENYNWRPTNEANLRHAFEEERELVIVNQGPDRAGFRICSKCGATWPSGDAKEQHLRPFLISNFMVPKGVSRYKCNGPLHEEPLFLGTKFRTDLLLLRLALRAPMEYSPTDSSPWLHDALRTLAETLSLSASRCLDIDPGELSAGYRFMPASVAQEEGLVGLVDVYLFDTASGGAGYAAEAGEVLNNVLDEALNILENCPENCGRSCTKCLRHYGNRFYHEQLDRFTAASLLRYARWNTLPTVPSLQEQITLLAPLKRYFELEGFTTQTGVTVAGIQVPLVVQPRGKGQRVVVGVFPALVNVDDDSFHHPLLMLSTDNCVVPLPDYVLTRDLPTSYQLICQAAGF